MYVHTFINPEIPQLTEKDTVEEALRKIEDCRMSALPLVLNGQLVALVKEDTLLDADDDTKPVQAVMKDNFLPPPFVLKQAHPYEAAVKMTELKSDLIPVIEDDYHYLGVVTRFDLFTGMVENSGLMRSGGILTLSSKMNDFSFSEIARICESCNAIPLNMQTFFRNEGQDMDVVLKVSTNDIQVLTSTFERFEYTVTEAFGDLPFRDDLKDRYDLLMNFINM